MQKAASNRVILNLFRAKRALFHESPRENDLSRANLYGLEGEVNPHGQEKGTEGVAKRSRAGFDDAERHSVVNSPGFDTE